MDPKKALYYLCCPLLRVYPSVAFILNSSYSIPKGPSGSKSTAKVSGVMVVNSVIARVQLNCGGESVVCLGIPFPAVDNLP